MRPCEDVPPLAFDVPAQACVTCHGGWCFGGTVPKRRRSAGTSVLIIVGVATDTARRIKAEKQMSKYGDIDDLYDKL